MKVDGAFQSLVQGVSEQPPQLRREGQSTEVTNMIPDPIRGLSRRWGSQFIAEKVVSGAAVGNAAHQTDIKSYRTYEYNNNGVDYVLMYRTGAKPIGSTLPPLFIYDRTNKVWLDYLRPSTETQVDLLEAGGISAITSIGKYVFMAGNTTVSALTTVDLWGSAGNQDKTAVWIRNGAYSRTYSATVTKLDNSKVTFSYTTPTASYQGTLDTTSVAAYVSDPAGGTETTTEAAVISTPGIYKLSFSSFVPASLVIKTTAGATWTNVTPSAPAAGQYAWVAGAANVTFNATDVGRTDITATYSHVKTVPNPGYTKQVSDIVNAYNTAVTQWLGTAAAAIAGSAIAESLKNAAVALGLSATRVDSTVMLTGVKAVSVQDGGDGTLIKGVANEVAAVSDLSAVHLVGKVVRIKSTESAESFYMKAIAKDGTATGNSQVTWVEGAANTRTITGTLLYGVVDTGKFCVAGTSPGLDGIKPSGGTFSAPTFTPSASGDVDNAPSPFFIGRKITFLGVFQDRLLIGSGAVVRASKTGDYLNMFRSTVLTVPADDPIEMLSQGSEDDELRYSVLYDQSCIIFGKKRQYVISGRVSLTPANANMAVFSSHAGAAELPPVAMGGLIFYGKQGTRNATLLQIQPGRVADSPESYSTSSQLDTFLSGRAIEVVAMTKPTTIVMRTTSDLTSLKLFNYLDTENGRVQDAWGKWQFNSAMGSILGCSAIDESGLLVYFLREAHGSVYCVADLCPIESGLATYPYLDSIRPYASLASGSLRTSTVTDAWVAFDSNTVYKFLGDSLANAASVLSEFPGATVLQAGYMQDSGFTPTNPFVKDRKEKPITTGRLTLTKYLVTYEDSSGFNADLTYGNVTTSLPFNGLITDDPDTIVGRVPIADGQKSVSVGRDTLEFSVRIKALTWLPLTIPTLEWVGQFFNRKQRV